MEIEIHERIKKRHPEIKRSEIVEAITNSINWKQRVEHNGEIIGIGVTNKGKFIEYLYIGYKDKLLVYHAQKATKKYLLS